ncbi:MAG: hypothetical protein AAFO03_19850, partial [Bacteroidota bacterium]
MTEQLKVFLSIILLVLFLVGCSFGVEEPMSKRAVANELSEMIDRSQPIFDYHARKVVEQTVDSEEIASWTQKSREEVEEIHRAVKKLHAKGEAITKADINRVKEIISKSDLPSSITEQIINPLVAAETQTDIADAVKVTYSTIEQVNRSAQAGKYDSDFVINAAANYRTPSLDMYESASNDPVSRREIEAMAQEVINQYTPEELHLEAEYRNDRLIDGEQESLIANVNDIVKNESVAKAIVSRHKVNQQKGKPTEKSDILAAAKACGSFPPDPVVEEVKDAIDTAEKLVPTLQAFNEQAKEIDEDYKQATDPNATPEVRKRAGERIPKTGEKAMADLDNKIESADRDIRRLERKLAIKQIECNKIADEINELAKCGGVEYYDAYTLKCSNWETRQANLERRQVRCEEEKRRIEREIKREKRKKLTFNILKTLLAAALLATGIALLASGNPVGIALIMLALSGSAGGGGGMEGGESNGTQMEVVNGSGEEDSGSGDEDSGPGDEDSGPGDEDSGPGDE